MLSKLRQRDNELVKGGIRTLSTYSFDVRLGVKWDNRVALGNLFLGARSELIIVSDGTYSTGDGRQRSTYRREQHG